MHGCGCVHLLDANVKQQSQHVLTEHLEQIAEALQDAVSFR